APAELSASPIATVIRKRIILPMRQNVARSIAARSFWICFASLVVSIGAAELNGPKAIRSFSFVFDGSPSWERCFFRGFVLWFALHLLLCFIEAIVPCQAFVNAPKDFLSGTNTQD